MKQIKIVLTASVALVTINLALYSCSGPKVTSKNRSDAKGADTSSFSFLFLSDVHLVDTSSASKYGHDAGTELWSFTKNKIHSVLQNKSAPVATKPQFLIYTGDLPEHEKYSTSERRDMDRRNVLLDLKNIADSNNIPVFYLPGNNDAVGNDYCLFSDKTHPTPFHNVFGASHYPWHAFHVDSMYSPKGAYMLPDANVAEGYYAAQIMKGLRIVALNSVIWSSSLCQSWACPADCDSQLSKGNAQMTWLKMQLDSAERVGDKVFLAMHIPPGADAYNTYCQKDKKDTVWMWGTKGDTFTWQNAFLDTVTRYNKTITGIFLGHTHMDEFRLLYNRDSSKYSSGFMQVAISSPGVSAKNYNNPGFKTVKVDKATMLPVDFTTYYTKPDKLKWKEPYTFSKLTKASPGVSIYNQLKTMVIGNGSNGQNLDSIHSLLNSIYAVKYDSVTTYHAYDMIGLKVIPK